MYWSRDPIVEEIMKMLNQRITIWLKDERHWAQDEVLKKAMEAGGNNCTFSWP